MIGPNTIEEVEDAFKTTAKILKKLNQPYKCTQFNIYQTVMSGYFKHPIYLEKLFAQLPQSTYNPEIFPALMFKNQKADLSFHISISGNGSFIINGLSG